MLLWRINSTVEISNIIHPMFWYTYNKHDINKHIDNFIKKTYLTYFTQMLYICYFTNSLESVSNWLCWTYAVVLRPYISLTHCGFFPKAVFVLGENHFWKCFFGNEAVWLVWKILFFGNWNPLTQKNSLWPRKCFYTSIFPSKHFRKMRERERERARARERRRSSPSRELQLQSEIASSSPSSSSNPRRDRDPRSRSRHGRRWWFFFSGLWLVFSDLCFPSSFPNTKY